MTGTTSKKCGIICMTPDALNFHIICKFCTAFFNDFVIFEIHLRSKSCCYWEKRIDEKHVPQPSKQTQLELVVESDVMVMNEQLEKKPFDIEAEYFDGIREAQQHILQCSKQQQELKETKYNGTQPIDQLADNKDPLELPAITVKQEIIDDCDDVELDKCKSGVGISVKAKVKTENELTSKDRKCEYNEFFKNKKYMIPFISILKRTSVLWDPKHVEYLNTKSKAKALEHVAFIMNTKFERLNLKAKNVDTLIKLILKVWTKMKTGKMAQVWYYTHLQFLNELKELNSDTSIEPNALEFLIEEFKKEENLWNPKHLQYLNKTAENLSYNRITQTMSDLFPKYQYNTNSIIAGIRYIKVKHIKMYTGKEAKIWPYKKLQFLDIMTDEELNAVNQVNWSKLLNLEQISDDTSTQITGMANEMFQKEQENVLVLEQKAHNDNGEVGGNEDFKGDQQQTEQVEMGINHVGVTFYLIKLYRKHENLWNNTDNHPDHLLYFTNFAKILNAHYNFKTELNFADVRDRIRQLQHDYETNNSASIYSKFLTFLPRPRPKKKPHKCSTCDLTFDRSEALLMHEYQMHNKHRPFKCIQCGKGFRTKYHLKKHSLVLMKKDELPYLCELCGEHFRCKTSCGVHKSKVHNAPWAHKCDICGTGFGARTQMLIHRRIHTGERPYLCQECGKSYRIIGSFIEHQDRHANNPRYKCTMCDKRYYNGAKLREHIKTHSSARDFVCDVCGKDFTLRDNLRTHKQIHSNDFKYKCRFCSQSFKQRSGCYNHMRQHKKHKNAE